MDEFPHEAVGTPRRYADDADKYEAVPPAPDESSSDEDPLEWESEGWDEIADKA